MSFIRILGSLIVVGILCGCDAQPPCARAELRPLAEQPHYAVVTSNDVDATAIALLDGRGERITGAWLDSGTTRPGLSTTLSGDVVLPTTTVTPGVLTLIDRLGVDRITRITVPEGEVLGQIPTTPQMQRGETAYRANPHDVLALDDGRALVSRYEPNLDPGAPRLDRGNDLVVVDLQSHELLDRIPMERFDEEIAAEGGSVRIVARPDRMVRAGGRVVVGLARLSVDFRTAGQGHVAVVDPEEGEVGTVPLPGLANCGEVVPVEADPDRVLVACAGETFAPEAERRAAAGVALLHVDDDGRGRVAAQWQADAHRDAPVPSHGIVSVGGSRLVAVAMGDEREGIPDRLLRIDLSDGSVQTLAETEEPFTLGYGAFGPDEELLLVPDTRGGVRRWQLRDDGSLEPAATATDVSPCRGLGARQVRPLR